MPSLNDRVLDNGLITLVNEGNRLDICSLEPTTFTQATSTNSLGNKTTPVIDAPSARTPNGRKVTVTAITNGTITANGTASHYAITDTVNSRLLATGSLSASLAVLIGYAFTTTSFDIGIPGAV